MQLAFVASPNEPSLPEGTGSRGEAVATYGGPAERQVAGEDSDSSAVHAESA